MNTLFLNKDVAVNYSGKSQKDNMNDVTNLELLSPRWEQNT